jgi:peptidoglycan/LPS O-acetylase OafA/YrhL
MTLFTPPEPEAAPQHRANPECATKYDYIDAVRGWAILLVISHHVAEPFLELPYPIKKLTNFGWHGVQLFFLASAMTLMMSWSRQSNSFPLAARNFFIRRFLRIAPMYYIGALIYYIAMPPDTGFDLGQLLRSFLFVNAWHPQWLPTTPGWVVVPGGWSIGVEFTFYALFPILAVVLTTLSRALLFAAAALVVAYFANQFGTVWYRDSGSTAVRNFLYFWFPNQAFVFALGIALYHFVMRTRLRIASKPVTYLLFAVVAAVCVVVAEHPSALRILSPLNESSTLLVAVLCFMVFIVVLAKGAKTVIAGAWMRRLGVYSFSAYVVHFLFVKFIPIWSNGLIDLQATGYMAMVMCLLLWVPTMICTVATAALAHKTIEQPGMNLARRLTARRRGTMGEASAPAPIQAN